MLELRKGARFAAAALPVDSVSFPARVVKEVRDRGVATATAAGTAAMTDTGGPWTDTRVYAWHADTHACVFGTQARGGDKLALLTTALLISQLQRIRTPLTKVVLMAASDKVRRARCGSCDDVVSRVLRHVVAWAGGALWQRVLDDPHTHSHQGRPIRSASKQSVPQA